MSRPVSKSEFVAVLSLLGSLDRDRYRTLRAQAWDEAVKTLNDPKSDKAIIRS